jgi:hypothetical protein
VAGWDSRRVCRFVTLRVSVEQAADDDMISVSDNTAANMPLVHGRDPNAMRDRASR